MSRAARVFGQRWTTILRLRACSSAQARSTACGCCGPRLFKRMVSNQLTESQRATAEVTGLPLFAAGHGFGMGVAVVLEPEQALPIVCGGGVGAVGWPGGFGGWWQADPNDNSVMIFLTHNMVELDQLEQGIGLGCLRRYHEVPGPGIDATIGRYVPKRSNSCACSS